MKLRFFKTMMVGFDVLARASSAGFLWAAARVGRHWSRT